MTDFQWSPGAETASLELITAIAYRIKTRAQSFALDADADAGGGGPVEVNALHVLMATRAVCEQVLTQ